MERGTIVVTWKRGNDVILHREWSGYDLLRATRNMIHDLHVITRNWHDTITTGESRNGRVEES